VSQQALRNFKDGSFIFFPVFAISARHDVRTWDVVAGSTKFYDGVTDFDQMWGIDANGKAIVGFSYPQKTYFELIGKTLHVIPQFEDTTGVTVPASDAVATAVGGKYVDTALSIQLVTRLNKQVWQIIGTKGTASVHVFIDPGTGALIAVE
jgi:hypothetical protein